MLASRSLQSLCPGVALVILLGCCTGKAEDKKEKLPAATFYPLKPGLKWEHSGKYCGQKYTETEEVEALEKVSDIWCFRIAKNLLRDNTIDQTEVHLTTRDDGSVHEVNGDKYVVFADPSCCILKAKSDKKQEWSYRSKRTSSKTGEAYSDEVRAFVQENDTIELDGKKIETIRVTCLLQEGKWAKTSWYAAGRGLVKMTAGYTGRDPDYDQTVKSISGSSTVEVGQVVLDPEPLEREGRVDTIEAPPGVVTELKKSRTISREVSLSVKASVGAELGLTGQAGADWLALKASATAKVKVDVEAALGEKLKDSETIEQTVKIDGDKLQTAKIIWIDTYRTGTISATHDGKTHKIPFEFPIGTRLVVRKTK